MAMKMDVTAMTMQEIEDLVSRMDRLCCASVLQASGGRLELKVY